MTGRKMRGTDKLVSPPQGVSFLSCPGLSHNHNSPHSGSLDLRLVLAMRCDVRDVVSGSCESSRRQRWIIKFLFSIQKSPSLLDRSLRIIRNVSTMDFRFLCVLNCCKH